MFCIAKEEKGLVCQCEECLTKRARLEAEKPKHWVATTLRYITVHNMCMHAVQEPLIKDPSGKDDVN